MIPTHNHSEFSALDGYGTAVEIADRVQSLGMGGAWLTDHGTVAGLLPFQKEMQARDLFWGMGMEAYQAPESRMVRVPQIKGAPKNDSFHLILLAQNYEGYMNLLRLADEANRSGFYNYPRVDWELLEKYNEGIIATSACMSGLVAKGLEDDDSKALRKYRNIFGDRFFIEIHTYEGPKQRKINEALVDICVEQGIYPIVANDAHYPSPDEYDAQELMAAVNMGRKFNPNSWNDRWHPPCLYIMDEDDVKEHLSYLDSDFVQAAIDNTDMVASASVYELPGFKIGSHLPKYPRTKNSGVELIDKVEAWLEGKPQEYVERAEVELDALLDAGLQDYFLIVQDFCNYAREHNIMVGPGRGSAGGSLVAYALGITSVDPIKYGLFFERFWNPGRASGLPDIDVDFEQSKRPEIKAYLANLYGEDRVLGIGNHIRFRPKSAIDRCAMAMSVNFNDARAISKIIDGTTEAGQLADWETIMRLVGDELKPWVDKYPDLFHYAEAITNRISTYGVHASAVVISDVDLPGELPLMRRTDKEKNEVFVTAHDMYSVEAQGFPKFDLLGLNTLDVLKTTAILAGEPEFDYESIVFEDLPDEAWHNFDKGHILGFFQFVPGTAGARIIKQMHPRSIEDLSVANSLNRPGPLKSGAAERYLARREGTREIEYVHPFMEQFLAPTYAEIVFQEQIIQLCWGLGYSLSDADHVRKILGKKKREDMRKEEPRFMELASAKMGQAVAEQVWAAIKEFSDYGFNKSHGVAYAIIAGWTMYAKWRWPQEFIMASIITFPDRRGDYIAEARRMGIKVNAPDVNISGVQITKGEDGIYMGLTEVKNVGAKAAQWIIDHRPEGGYESYTQFTEIHAQAQHEHNEMEKLKRPKLSPSQLCNTRAVSALVQAGAFDKLMEREITIPQRIELERELLGIVLTDIYTPIIKAHGDELEDTMSYTDLEEFRRGTIPGIITNVRPMKVGPGKRNAGREMGHVTVEWESDEIRITIFPDDWDELQEEGALAEHSIALFTVEQNSRGTNLKRMKVLDGTQA